MFILKQNSIICGFAKTQQELNKLNQQIPNSIIENTDKEYFYVNGRYLTEEEKTQEEQDLINHLICTALDLVQFIRSLGVQDEVILQYLNNNPSIQLQLTLCKDVYCGVVRQLCPIKITEELTLTDENIVNFFKQKHNIT